MSTLEDVKQLMQQGRTENEIVKTLSEKGLSAKEISDSISQAKIKAAVGEPQESEEPKTFIKEAGFEGMEQSMLVPQPAAEEAVYPPQEYQASAQYLPQQYVPPQQYAQPAQEYAQAYQPYPEQGYEQYQPYAGGISPDTITEISEQIFTEKISDIKKALSKIADFKTTAEAKISFLDERMKRIEQILDRLQLSILQKVGEYVTSVADMKTELTETQKSFKALLEKKPKHPKSE